MFILQLKNIYIICSQRLHGGVNYNDELDTFEVS
jgi:hypothetical protein